MRESTVEQCVGTCGLPLIPGGKKHKVAIASVLSSQGQQSKLHALLLDTWCFHDDGMENKQTSEFGDGVAVCPEGLFSWVGVHSSIGGVWGHGQGGMPYIL